MDNKKTYAEKCFSPDWIEIDLDEISDNRTAKEVQQTAGANARTRQEQYNKEARLESRRRKDLNTLLKEGKITKISGGRYTKYKWNR